MSFLQKLKNGIKIETSREKPKKPEKKRTEKAKIEIKDEKWLETEGELAVDVYQTNKEIIIEAPVAGIKVEDLNISIEDDTIQIKGKRNRLKETEKKDYFLQECYWGPFSRKIILPIEVKGTKASASMKQGILIIKVPKITRKKKKKIKIEQK